MKQRLKELVEKHIEKIDEEDFSKIFDEALQEGLVEELLDLFHDASVSVPPEQLAKALSVSYVTKHSDKERATYLFNKHLIVAAKLLEIK
jgi:hypothetical protein